MNKQQWQRRINTLEKELAELKANPPKREPGERWEPEVRDEFWFVKKDGFISHDIWTDAIIDIEMLDNFNVFQTKEEAEFQVERIKVMRELDLWAMENVRKIIGKYYIYYDSDGNTVSIDKLAYYAVVPHVFKSKEIAQKAIQAIGEDRLKKYYFKVVD